MTSRDQPARQIVNMALRRVKEGGGAYRADISRMLGRAAPDDLARVRSAVACYRPQDTADLDSMIELACLESA